MKQVIFNVGAGLCSYMEYLDNKILIDVAKSESFNPVNDFLIPLFRRRNSFRSINQLIISHPHKDHISAIEDLNRHFTISNLITTPNDNPGMPDEEKINWDLLDNLDDPSVKVLRKMLINKTPPLRPYLKGINWQRQWLYYLNPTVVEDTEELKNESYVNNISIMSIFDINGYITMMPGDIQTAAMKTLINAKSRNGTPTLKDFLAEHGVDVLVTPHHGLKSSFSKELFDAMKGKKTRCINIVSEKRNTDDNRDVAKQYSQSDHCDGKNSLSKKDDPHYQIRTSRGHVYIDYKETKKLHIEILPDINDVITRFIKQ